MNTGQKQPKDANPQLLELLYEVSRADGFREATACLLDHAARLLPCDGTSVMWSNGDHLEVLASRGAVAPVSGLILPASQIGMARAVLDSNKPVIVPDTTQDARWQQVPGEEQARAWLGVPLSVEERVIGLLEWTARLPTDWTGAEVETALQAARYAAPILYRAQLLDDARQRLRERMMPGPILEPRIGDLSAELQPIVEEALEFTGAEHAFVFLLTEEDTRLQCVAAAGSQQDSLRKATLRGDGTLGGWRVTTGRPAEWLSSGPSDRDVMAALKIQETLILPLRVAGGQVGMLGVAEPRRGSAFGRDAIQLMTHLASQASLIVEQVYRARRKADRVDYEPIVRSSPLGIGVLTVAGDIRLCNPALAHLLSPTDRDVSGHNLLEFLVPSDRQRLLHALEEVAITGMGRQVDVRIQSTRGENRHARISLAVTDRSNEAGEDLIAILEDITSLKILERERVKHLRELREKNEQLQELDQLKSRFVSNVSHELRTPLAVIKLYATLARRGRPEKQDHYLQTIEQETHRLETMVENILDLTRMDRHTLRINPEWLAVEEIIAQVVQVYEETAQKRGIALRNHVREKLPPLWADKNHLIQMLTNLIDNALKYTPRGGQVWVAAREIGRDSRRMLEIAVGDTGTGIPKEEQEKVFERFYRGSNNTPGSTGTGLGLAIVQELMHQHGGQVTLKSQVGEGSVFALQFPLPASESGSEGQARVG